MTRVTELRKSVPWRADFASLSPVLAPFVEVATSFASAAEFPSPEAIHEALAARATVAFVRSVPKTTRPSHRRGRPKRDEGDLYDASIFTRREVPTRDGSWHDLLNALVWCLFPAAKWAIHARQFALVSRGLDASTGRLPGARTREQDALALFDEGGAVITSRVPLRGTDEIEAALASGAAHGVVFGHAIHESIVLGHPWPMVRAIVVPPDDVDASVADAIARLADPNALPRVSVAAIARAGAPLTLARGAAPPSSPSP